MKFPGKKPGLVMGLALLLLLGLIIAPAAPSRAAEADVAMYYDALSPYGNWVDYGNYGPVWYPTQGVTQNWRPYMDGRWVPTTDGWVFETGEPWGWATYHFGNWMPTTEYGWVWDPGSTWYPSTAAWRTSDEYVGWAPIPPPDFVPEPAYYPTGGYYSGMPALDLLSAPFWIFAQAANFLLGFGNPYAPAYSYYNTGYLAPYSYVPFLFANTLFLSDFYYPPYNRNAFYCYGPSFPFVSRVTNINIVNINNFAGTANFNHIRGVVPSQAVFNRHPWIRDAVPASVRESGRFQANRATNTAQAARQLTNPRVSPAPSNVPRLTKEIPKGAAPQAQPAARAGARGVPVAPRGATAPKAVTTPRGEAAPRGVTAPRGEAAPRGVTAPRHEAAPRVTPPAEHRAPTGEFAAPGRERVTPSRELRAPTRAPERAPAREFTAPARERVTPTREFRAPSRGTTMPPPSTHEVTPRMQQQIRQFQAPSRPAPSAPAPRMAPSAPAARPAPSAPAPHVAPSAPAPRPSAPAPAPRSAPAPSGGGGGGGGEHRK